MDKSKERPILFSGPMVRAILDGKKTQTRRVLKDSSADTVEVRHVSGRKWVEMFVVGRVDGKNPDNRPTETKAWHIKCPYGEVGDRLWVRETWCQDGRGGCEKNGEDAVYYRADFPKDGIAWKGFWKPSIHMPRWASRITLEITGLRVERLQDISEEDAIAEGVERGIYCGVDDEGPALRSIDCEADEQLASYRDGFRFVWECINGQGSWESNPWVWVVQFKRIKP